MRLAIRHSTHYRFDRPVSHGLHRLRLTPKGTQGQAVIDWSIELSGARRELEYDDQHCNHVTLISLDAGTTELVVTCHGLVETRDNAGVIGQHSGHLPLWAFLGQTLRTRPGPRMRLLAAQARREAGGTLAMLHGLSRMVLEQCPWGLGSTHVHTTGEEALVEGVGVCQDHVHIFLGAARLLDVPARYVSGYLMMDDRVEQDASHAWAEAHVEGLGWVGFDISNAISPDARYVRLATGLDYADAAPMTGMSWGAGESELRVSLAVEQQLVEQ